LSQGRFRWWPDTGALQAQQLSAHELQLLLWNGNPVAAPVGAVWKKNRGIGIF
jgi:hypothetical protein